MNTNPFARLQRLIPGDPLLTGTVVSGGGSAWVVALPGGGQIAVRGEATVGQQVFVRAGAIEGAAPALTSVNIEV